MMANWYLVLQLVASIATPGQQAPQLLGPVTEQQCEAAKAKLGQMGDGVVARCRKAIAMQSSSNGPIGYAVPIFEGEIVTTASH